MPINQLLVFLQEEQYQLMRLMLRLIITLWLYLLLLSMTV